MRNYKGCYHTEFFSLGTLHNVIWHGSFCNYDMHWENMYYVVIQPGTWETQLQVARGGEGVHQGVEILF